MGLEFRESANVLSADSQVPVRAGMVFNVAIGEHFTHHCQMDVVYFPDMIEVCQLSRTKHLNVGITIK